MKTIVTVKRLYLLSVLLGVLFVENTVRADVVNYSHGTNTNNTNLGNDAVINISGGTNTFNGTINNNADINIAGGDTTFNGSIKNNADIEINGGTVIFNTAIKNNAVVAIAGGSLLVGSDDLFGENANFTLNGGTLNTQGYDLSINSLTLTADSVIDLGGADANIDLGNLQGFSSGYTLTFINYSDNDSINFGSNNTGLSTAQLESQILFGSMQGAIAGNQIAPNEIAPVPEPSTWAGIGLVLGFAFYRERRRLAGQLRALGQKVS